MRNKFTILLAIVSLMLFVGLAHATTSLPPVKQGECINLPQTCATCTYNNISVIRYPNNGSYALIGEYAMTKNGISYNFTFCNTTQFGTYFVDGYGDVNGVKTGWGGYTFDVNGSGQTINQSQIILILIGLSVLLIMAIFFFILSIMFKHPGTKIFLMALSTITLIILIGLVASNASVYLSEFANLSDMYNSYYMVMIILAGVAMLGIIIWLIYYSFTLFNKTRGTSYDED